MHRTAGDNGPTLFTDVVEMGGFIESVRGDTLIMQPHYMLMRTTRPSGEVQVVRYSSMRVLPDLAFIPAGPGFRLDSPSDTRRRGPSVTSILAFSTIALYVAFGSW